MTTCVVEFSILIPEFPGGCGGKVIRKRERERGVGVYGLAFLEKEKKKEKKKKKKKETKDNSHKLIHLSQIPKCSLNPHPAVRSNQST